MTPGLIFLVQALVVIALPVALLRFARLKGLVPLVVIQIVVGIALGPSLFGRLAPGYYHVFQPNGIIASLRHRIGGGSGVRLDNRTAPRRQYIPEQQPRLLGSCCRECRRADCIGLSRRVLDPRAPSRGARA
jgi:hypothetical protein